MSSAITGPIVLAAQRQQNAEMMQKVLNDHGFTCAFTKTIDALVEAIRTDAALVIITEDMLALDPAMDQLVSCLNQQPDWSNIPVLFLLKDCQRFPSCLTALRKAQYQRGVTLLEVPLKPYSFISIVRSCLQNRQQQYALRDTLRRLQESNQELEQFSYTVAHDLKAPLRGANNISQWLREDLGDSLPSESQDHLQLLDQRLHRMETMIDELLEYSRLGRLEEQPQQVDVEALIQESATTLRASPDINIRLIRPLPTLEARALKLGRVFSNLINNAIKYGCTGQQGEITIASKKGSSWYEFSVADKGPGIDPVHHRKIFGIFETLQSANAQSTGIGLAIVKKLVETEGGSVRVESERGKGATFFFTWPEQPRP